MKKLFLLLIVVFFFFIGFYFYHQQTPITDHPLPEPSEKKASSTIEKLNPIMINAATYYYAYTLIEPIKNLHFYSNLKDQLSSEELISKRNCKVLVNGGFYSEDFKPLGWLVSNGKELSKPISSLLFNGYLSISNKKALITSYVPENVSSGLQTGPLLIQNNQPLPLKIRNDQPRRRLAAVLTINKKLLFIAITSKDSLFQGPLLRETPIILKAISSKIEIPFTHAINLDGGSASTFYTSKVHLKEFSPIGSFFCLL